MLNTEELINKLRLLGIRFNIINEEDAKHILSKNTYYFKLGYYRTNFPKKITNIILNLHIFQI